MTTAAVLHSEKQFSGRQQLRVDQGGGTTVVWDPPPGAAHAALYEIKLSGTVWKRRSDVCFIMGLRLVPPGCIVKSSFRGANNYVLIREAGQLSCGIPLWGLHMEHFTRSSYLERFGNGGRMCVL